MIEQTGTLVKEALVREIISADRWQTVESAWHALLKVEMLIRQHIHETSDSNPNQAVVNQEVGE